MCWLAFQTKPGTMLGPAGFFSGDIVTGKHPMLIDGLLSSPEGPYLPIEPGLRPPLSSGLRFSFIILLNTVRWTTSSLVMKPSPLKVQTPQARLRKTVMDQSLTRAAKAGEMRCKTGISSLLSAVITEPKKIR